MEKFIILVSFDEYHEKPLQIVAPESWGNTAEEVASKLAEVVNEESDYVAIGNYVVVRGNIRSGIVKPHLAEVSNIDDASVA